MGIFRKDIALRSDEELVRLLHSNHRNGAITELHKRYGNKSLGFFIRMLNGDKERSQDLNQDLFLRVMEKHESFNPELNFYTWLFTIARNMCFSELKRSKKSEMLIGENAVSSPSQEGEFDKGVFRKQLANALSGLSQEHKLAFELRYLQELSVKEIAVITEVPEGTVKSRLFHATKKVSAELTEFHPQNEKLFKLS